MRDLCKTALRVMAVYIFIRSIMYLQSIILSVSTIVAMESRQAFLMALSFVFSFIIIVVIGICLWRFSDKLAGIIVKDDIPLDLPFGLERLQAVTFTVVGVVLVTNVIPELIGDIYKYLELRSFLKNLDNASLSKAAIGERASIISDVIKALIGIYLVLGAKGIVNLIKSLEMQGFIHLTMKIPGIKRRINYKGVRDFAGNNKLDIVFVFWIGFCYISYAFPQSFKEFKSKEIRCWSGVNYPYLRTSNSSNV